MTDSGRGPDDARLIQLLRDRAGIPTLITLRSGASITVLNIAWGYDVGDTYAHVTTNISPGISGMDIDFFFTDQVDGVTDADSGEDLSEVLGR